MQWNENAEDAIVTNYYWFHALLPSIFAGGSDLKFRETVLS